ncbi:MAG: pitrilysin family protein [Verrucomicrobiales bacterium]|nr:pitrilysin family protein [Verrucomicrobiales bacterium]
MKGNPESLDFPPSSARVWTLGNGLEIIVKEDHSAPVVSLQAWCRAGSIHEGNWLGAGLSHFLEHMLFKGTESRDANEIAQTVQAQGGYINAYTSFDRTVYWIDAPSSGTEVCLDVLCDVVGFAQLPEDEFANESDVIRREIAMGQDNPEQVLNRALFNTAYTNHPCRYPVIGHLDLFNQLSRDELYDYYREKYSPDNLFIVIAGDVDGDAVVAAIEKQLGGLERRRRSPVVIPAEPAQLGIRQERVEFPTDLHRCRLAWPIPDGSHPDVPAIDLLTSILGDGRSSRLYREIREEKQLAHSVGAYAYTPSFPGQLVVSFDTDGEKVEAAEAAILRELERFAEAGGTEEELDKAKHQGLAAQFSTLSDMRGQASDLGSNWLLTRNLDYTGDYARDLQQVSLTDLQRVAKEYLIPHRFSRVSLVPKEEGAAIQRGGSTAKRSEEIRKVELDNGLTVLLLADHRLPFVQGTGVFRGGLLAESEPLQGLTRLMAKLLVKDTKRQSAASLADQIESVGGGIGSSIGNNTFGVSVSAMRPDLDLVLDLLGESLLEPAFFEEVVSKEKEFQLAQIKAERDRPFSVAMKSLRKAIYGDHPYGLEVSGTEESLARIGRAEVVSMHDRLVRGGNGVVGVFGDLDLNRAEDLVRSRFETDLATGAREFTQPFVVSWPEAGGSVIELEHEKEQAVLLIGFKTVDLVHEDNPALELIDEACSDMASRLFIRIREELGLAYSVGTTRLPGLEPGMIIFYASTSPEKLDLVQEEMIAEIELMRREGLAPEEFERAKASWLGKEVIHLQGVRELAGTASVDELVGLGWDNYRKAPGIMQKVTSQEVQSAAARYLGAENRVIVRLASKG